MMPLMVVIIMELNERKLKILQAIISNYFETAEPVGSRTISKNYDLGVSPATIRNEMSDLEELGFIIQPHTSSGRIPSDKGYRLYVDLLMEAQKAEMKKLAYFEEMMKSAGRIENVLKDIVRVLARETNYATLVSTPQYKKSKIKNIQLVSLESKKILVVVVTDANVIKNFMLNLNEEVNQSVLNKLTYVLSERLYGLKLEEINLPLIQELKRYAKSNEEVISKVLDVIFKAIKDIDNDSDIFTSGTINILKFPEFNDIDKATNLIYTLEEKDILKNILDTSNEDDNITIKIGEENDIEEMKDCSLITASYHLGEQTVGTIGIIGPKRMDYLNTISSLKCLIANMEKIVRGL
jgi:heat-inducible transcriptional repressor